jgi:hypothetical protein
MYCDINDLRMEGVLEATVDDAGLARRIRAACAKIDLWTGLWFEARQKTFFLDGRGGRLLDLDIPAIALTGVSVDGENIPLASVRIVDEGYSLLLQPGWRRGLRNIEISGTFGVVVPSDETPGEYETPSPIVEVAKRLTLREIVPLTDGSAQEEMRIAGRIVSETTDGHSYTLANTADTTVTGAYGSWTGDPFIDSILMSYQPPIKIGCA